MNYKDVKPGKYTARVIDHGFLFKNDQITGVGVTFDVEVTPTDHVQMNWYGSLKEGKAREITIDALLTMGLKGNAIPPEFADGVKSGAMDYDQQVSVAIQLEPNPNKNNELFPRIKWVNRVGGAGFAKEEPQKIKANLAHLNLTGDILARRQETGIKVATPSLKTGTDDGNDSDIPF